MVDHLLNALSMRSDVLHAWFSHLKRELVCEEPVSRGKTVVKNLSGALKVFDGKWLLKFNL